MQSKAQLKALPFAFKSTVSAPRPSLHRTIMPPTIMNRRNLAWGSGVGPPSRASESPKLPSNQRVPNNPSGTKERSVANSTFLDKDTKTTWGVFPFQETGALGGAGKCFPPVCKLVQHTSGQKNHEDPQPDRHLSCGVR